MKRGLTILAVIGTVACGGNSNPTTPSTPPTTSAPTPTTFTLSGTVTSTSGGAGISGATVRVGDGANAGRSTTTASNGTYSLTGLAVSGFSVSASATNYTSVGKPVTLTSSQTVDFQLTPTPIFVQSGVGDNVFTVPNTVTRMRIDATYGGFCQNFIVHISTTTVSLVNVIMGTCSVADAGTRFSGTYLINNGGTVTITTSTGINWTFTEVR